MRMLRAGSETCELLKNRMRTPPEMQRSAVPPTCGCRGICHPTIKRVRWSKTLRNLAKIVCLCGSRAATKKPFLQGPVMNLPFSSLTKFGNSDKQPVPPYPAQDVCFPWVHLKSIEIPWQNFIRSTIKTWRTLYNIWNPGPAAMIFCQQAFQKKN